MERYQRVLLSLAVLGWIGALLSQIRALGAEPDEASERRTLSRNRFVLLSSVSMNALVASVIYRFVTRLRRVGESARADPVVSDEGSDTGTASPGVRAR